MNGVITRDGADYILGLMIGGEVPAANYYVALITGAQPGVSISGEELDEPDAPEYLRGVLENVSGNWSIDNGTMMNMVEVDFPVPTTSWGDIRHWAICDELIGGRALFVGSFSEAFSVLPDEQPYVGVAALSVDLGLSDWKVDE